MFAPVGHGIMPPKRSSIESIRSRQRQRVILKKISLRSINRTGGYPLDSAGPNSLWLEADVDHRLVSGWRSVDGLLHEPKNSFPRLFDVRRLKRNVNSSKYDSCQGATAVDERQGFGSLFLSVPRYGDLPLKALLLQPA